ncbi:MAG: DUF6519 domain-containing protein [Anaerolineae bacterium]
MHGDFTRLTFDRKKHYTNVLDQQGRVTLDAGWNEYVEIQAYLNQTEAKDVIGLCGVPKTVVPDEVRKALEKELSRELNPKELEEVLTAKFGVGLFKAGKYVGGFMVGSKDGDLTIAPGRIYVDGILCELDKIDVTYTKQPDYPNPPKLKPADGRADLVYLDVWQRHITAIEDPDIREVALGGPDTTTRVKTVWQVKVLPNVGNVNCDDTIKGWPPPSSGGRLTTEAVPTPAAEDPCLIPPGGGYRGLENRLYRVEIHDGSESGAPTFKWSRDNGSVVFAIDEFVMGDTVTVKRLKRDQVLALHVGDWVEVLDDETELKNDPGTLTKITAIDEAKRTLTLSKSVSSYDIKRHAKVRRWDQGKDAIAVTAGPISLEDGIQIRFSGSNFKTGDYWVFAARTATGDVERLTNAPPRGIVHHYCRLALVSWHVDAAGSVTAKVHDCRKPFPPLTAITAGDVSYRDIACKLGAKTVQEALDVLCKRQPGPAIGGLCTVTLGVNGVSDLQDAVDRLEELSLEGGWKGGCICIPAGEWRQESGVEIRGRERITIKGCGPASRIRYDDPDPLFVLEQSTDILFKDFAVFCEQATAFAVQGVGNAELTIEGCHINAPLGIVLRNNSQLDGLFVRHNHFEAPDQVGVSPQAVHIVAGGGSLTNAQIAGNTIEGARMLFEVLSEGADVVLARNRISVQQASAVEVGTMESKALLSLTENQIETDGMGVVVNEMKSEARLILEENRLMTKGDEEAIVVQGAENDGEVHLTANVFKSPESMPVISIGGTVNETGGVAHVLFSNNQVYSSQAPDQQHCTVELNGRRLVVMGNYVADERGEWEEGPPGTSICLPKKPEAVTAIGNVTRNGVAHEGRPVTDKLVVVNNAVF